MPLTTAQIAQLKTELQTDPRGYGYNAAVRNDTDMAEKINRVRDGAAGNVPSNPTAAGGSTDGKIKIQAAAVDTGAMRAATTYAAYNGLTAGDRAFFNWLTGAGAISVNADNLQSLAGVPTATGSIWATADRAVMNAAMDLLLRPYGSRGAELFGRGVTVSIDDVGKALN